MSNLKRIVGPAVAEWSEDQPLRWTMSENIGEGKRVETKKFTFDLTPLLVSYHSEFLLALKEFWIERRLQVSLNTINGEVYAVFATLRFCQNEFAKVRDNDNIGKHVFKNIDSDLITCIFSIKDKIPRGYLVRFKTFFNKNRHNAALFGPGLHKADFYNGKLDFDSMETLGEVGKIRKNILASALNRATLVQILNITETAYEVGEISLDVFAYSRLLLARALRTESLRLLRLKDLQIDEIDGKKVYFLTISIPKARTEQRPLVPVRINDDLGLILDRQRAAVAERLGYLIEKKNAELRGNPEASEKYSIGDLPMFPITSDARLQVTQDRLGMASLTSTFNRSYMIPLRKLTRAKISHIALRHTMGTQLAIAGCSAPTIAAVLLHATDRTAAVYVDLVFSGVIDELSDSLEPEFAEHFPVYKELVSINDVKDPTKQIVSSSLDQTHHRVTGECGRHQICHYAPISCYECSRFKPCYDVDHRINLERVNEEIESARIGGHARQSDLKRYQNIANRIRVVIRICEEKLKNVA